MSSPMGPSLTPAPVTVRSALHLRNGHRQFDLSGPKSVNKRHRATTEGRVLLSFAESNLSVKILTK
jgi:hypothetical protein